MAVAAAGLGSRAVALTFVMRTLGFRFPNAFFVRVGTASIIMALVLMPFVYFFPPVLPVTVGEVALNIGFVVLGAGVFLVGFKLLGGIDAEDKERFRSLRLPFVNRALRFL